MENMVKKNLENQIEIEMLAKRIKLLFAFLAELIPYKEKFKEVAEKTSERSSMALGMAPILGAFGQDWEEIHLQKEIERKRAKVLYNLVNVLDKTEKERAEFADKKNKKDEGLNQLKKMLDG